MPTTPPTRAWEVETGNPKREAIKMVVAVAISAQNPLLGWRGMMFSPIVAITFLPQTANPATIPLPPRIKIHRGTLKPVKGTEPVRMI
jgi:hypothetical protein